MWKHACVAAFFAVLSLTNYTPAIALAVPERYQVLLPIVGWEQENIPALAEIIQCESSWNTLAVGAAGELGLGQLMPSTWTSLPNAPEIDYWYSPAANLYTAHELYLREGWEPWTCADLLGITPQ